MSPLLLLVLCSSAVASGRRDRYTNHWAVQILGGPDQADAVAAKYGYRNLGQVRVCHRSSEVPPAREEE